MKHTGGTWKWVGNRLRNDKNKIVFTTPQFDTKDRIEEAKANAKLIAAAPDLLEALIKANEVLVNLPKAEFMIELLRECNQAIKKATE